MSVKWRLYVWTKGVLTDYSDGCAVAAARSVDEARRTIIENADPRERDSLAACIHGEPDFIRDLPAAHHEWGGA